MKLRKDPLRKHLLKVIQELDDIEYIDKEKLEDGWVVSTAEHFGGEGHGEDYWVVLKLTKEGVEDTFWKVPGWYQSYHGSELTWEDTFRVNQVEKVVKVWEKA